MTVAEHRHHDGRRSTQRCFFWALLQLLLFGQVWMLDRYGFSPIRFTTTMATIKKNQKQKQQRVVLLAGPHKTASTSIQSNIYRWLKDPDHPSHLARDGWIWPTPLDEFRRTGYCNVTTSSIDSMRINSHVYWPFKALKGESNIPCYNKNDNHSRSSSTKNQKQLLDDFLEFYRREFYDRWMEEKSLVVASEAMDYVASTGPRYSHYLDDILNLLPWHYHSNAATGSATNEAPHGNDYGSVTVVVVYRSNPRSDHLKSIWHQCCMNTESFYGFLTGLARHKDSFMFLDSLDLAKKFLDRGLKVVLLDMAGVMAKKLDISHVIACDVLNSTTCSSDTKRFDGEDDDAVRLNVREGKIEARNNVNVTSKQMDVIDDLIQSYDCNYVPMLRNHPNLTMLYPYSLSDLIRKCDGLDGNNTSTTYRRGHNDVVAAARTREELARQITVAVASSASQS